MIIAGMFAGMSSQAMIRAKSSAVLFVTSLVPYAAGRGWTRVRRGMVGRSVHGRVGCELLMAVTVTLAVALATVGCCGWLGG